MLYIANAAGILTPFPGLSNITDSIYRRWAGGRGLGWVARTSGDTKAGSSIFDKKSSHCKFIEVHKQPQFTCLTDTVTGSSLPPSVALLVHTSGTVHSIVDCHEFTGSHRNDASENRPGYL